MSNKPRIGYLFTYDYSQTEKDTVCVIGCKTYDEALAVAKKGTSCIRVHRAGQVDLILDKHGNKV